MRKTQRLPSLAPGTKPAFARRRTSSGWSLRNEAASRSVRDFIPATPKDLEGLGAADVLECCRVQGVAGLFLLTLQRAA